MRMQLVVNQTRVRTDAELGAWMSGLVSRHYGVALDELGHIEHDDTVWLTVRRNKPLLVDSPTSKSARNIERIARRVLALAARRPAERGAAAARSDGRADALRRARRDALGERRGGPPRLQAAARDLRDGGPRDRVAARRARSSPARSGSSTRPTTRCSIRCAAAPTTCRPSPTRSPRSLSARTTRPALAAEQLMLQEELHARDRTGHRVHRRAPPQGARVAGPRARRHQREDQDRPGAPAGDRRRALRGPAGARVHARLPRASWRSSCASIRCRCRRPTCGACARRWRRGARSLREGRARQRRRRRTGHPLRRAALRRRARAPRLRRARVGGRAGVGRALLRLRRAAHRRGARVLRRPRRRRAASCGTRGATIPSATARFLALFYRVLGAEPTRSPPSPTRSSGPRSPSSPGRSRATRCPSRARAPRGSSSRCTRASSSTRRS